MAHDSFDDEWTREDQKHWAAIVRAEQAAVVCGAAKGYDSNSRCSNRGHGKSGLCYIHQKREKRLNLLLQSPYDT